MAERTKLNNEELRELQQRADDNLSTWPASAYTAVTDLLAYVKTLKRQLADLNDEIAKSSWQVD